MSISLSRETIHLMMQSQRMVKKEFGIHIGLDDDQAIAQFIAYSAQSTCSDLKQCASQLMQALIPAKKEKPVRADTKQSKKAVRMYRGQEVIVDESQLTDKQADNVQTKTSKNVIYRGQRVS